MAWLSKARSTGVEAGAASICATRRVIPSSWRLLAHGPFTSHKEVGPMNFRPFYYYDLGCAAYLLGCGTVGKCAVVDARTDDVNTYASFAESKGMRITHVIDTHVHADHRSGGRELARLVDASYCLHESADVSFPFTGLRDNQEVELGNTRLRV